MQAMLLGSITIIGKSITDDLASTLAFVKSTIAYNCKVPYTSLLLCSSEMLCEHLVLVSHLDI